ncbi:hypothetical protein SERLA73DRAFT_180333, partial [Serpula lacrymans var. lacrymans S7.3]
MNQPAGIHDPVTGGVTTTFLVKSEGSHLAVTKGLSYGNPCTLGWRCGYSSTTKKASFYVDLSVISKSVKSMTVVLSFISKSGAVQPSVVSKFNLSKEKKKTVVLLTSRSAAKVLKYPTVSFKVTPQIEELSDQLTPTPETRIS